MSNQNEYDALKSVLIILVKYSQTSSPSSSTSSLSFLKSTTVSRHGKPPLLSLSLPPQKAPISFNECLDLINFILFSRLNHSIFFTPNLIIIRVRVRVSFNVNFASLFLCSCHFPFSKLLKGTPWLVNPFALFYFFFFSFQYKYNSTCVTTASLWFVTCRFLCLSHVVTVGWTQKWRDL